MLACDQSTTKFGLAVGDDTCGSPRVLVIKGPGADELRFDRFLMSVYETIYTLATMTKSTRCVIETPLLLPNRSAHTAMALIQLTGVVRAAASKAGCEISLVAVSTARKHFIGRGNLPSAEAKKAVMERCRLLNWNFQDDNGADACCLWSWGMSTFHPKWSPRSTPLFGRSAA